MHWKILIGLALGCLAGVAANIYCDPAAVQWVAHNIAEPVGQIFLRLIFMVVLMLVFSALVLGIVEIGDVRKLGRLGAATLAYTIVLSAVSVAIGIGMANVVRPGERLPEDKRAQLLSRYQSQSATAVAQSRKKKSLRDTLLDLIPRNPLQEMVGALDGSSPGGGMLAVMVFALLFGIAVTLTPKRTATLIAGFQGLFDVAMVIIGWAMQMAPIGVAGLMFSLTSVLGLEILRTLFWYMATVLAGLGIHLALVYSIVLLVFARRNPWRFFKQIKEAMLTAFATSSSNATLPTALRVAEEDAKIRPAVSRFVLTIGATGNQNGTALYEGLTVLFLAQVFQVELQLMEQITVVLMAVLAGIGTAGVPGGSLPLIAMVLVAVGIPAEGIGIILGVDRLLDMCRTTLNVSGDIVIAACVDRTGGRLAA